MNELQMKFIFDKKIVRIFKLLDILEQKGEISISQLINTLKVSKRTIIYDIQEISGYFKHTIRLDSSLKGYNFSILDHRKYVLQKEKLLINEPMLIILESIFFNKCLSVYEWSIKLFLSESSIFRYINIIKHHLADYDIDIATNPIDLIGKEINIREFFHDFYYESDITPYTVFPSSKIHKITFDLTTKNFFAEYAPLYFEDLNYYIFVAITRFFNGKEIESVPLNLICYNKKKEELYFNNVHEVMVKHFGEDLSINEKRYLYYILLVKRSVNDYKAEVNFLSLLPTIDKVELWIKKYMDQHVSSNIEIKKIKTFIKSFFYSIYIKHSLSPILNQTTLDVKSHIKRNYSSHYEESLLFIANFLAKDLQLNERETQDISANLTIFIDSLFALFPKKKLKIAFILEGNYYICDHIRAVAVRYLGESHLLTFVTADKIHSNYFKKNYFDLVVTNYYQYVTEYLHDYNHLIFNRIPSANDWNSLFKIAQLIL